MRRFCAWLAVALTIAAIGCTKKSGEHDGADSTGAVSARPGMRPVPGDSIPRGPWMWLGTIGLADTIVVPDSSQYTLEFLPDSTARLMLFCNRGSGRYHVDGESIRIGPIAATRMACPPPTYDAEFGSQLDAVRRWYVRGDTLRLDVPGFGIMTFLR